MPYYLKQRDNRRALQLDDIVNLWFLEKSYIEPAMIDFYHEYVDVSQIMYDESQGVGHDLLFKASFGSASRLKFDVFCQQVTPLVARDVAGVRIENGIRMGCLANMQTIINGVDRAPLREYIIKQRTIRRDGLGTCILSESSPFNKQDKIAKIIVDYCQPQPNE